MHSKATQCNKFNIVTCISIARQQIARHILTATNKQATVEELPFLFYGNIITIEELLGYGVLVVFSVRGACRRFIGDKEGHCKKSEPNQSQWKTLVVQ
jgi:hypothetical protein